MCKEYTREEIVDYLDDNQKELSTHFPNGHFLSSQTNCENTLMLITYYRRNLHRFVMEYLGIHLYWYQQILLYFMGICSLVVIVAARASAKSFIVAVYNVSVAILYPQSTVGITSGTRGQSRLIITKKILNELVGQSPRLESEIDSYTTSQGETKVTFKNKSQIWAITLSPNSRGYRTTVNVGEEAREINKAKYDEVISPFLFVRPAPFLTKPYYSIETAPEIYNLVAGHNTEIFISSSVEDTHWLYKIAKDAATSYYKGDNVCFFAMDYSISLQCGIRRVEQLKQERKKIDSTTWAIEYENAILRSNSKSYFDYDLIKSVQVVNKAFYPRRTEDFVLKKPNSYGIPKLPGEVRIIAADIAMIDRDGNDNSCYSCLRLIPEIESHGGKEQSQYSVKIPYLEAPRGMEMRKQAIRIRQLYADFDADYIVLDVRNAGITVMDSLCRTLYDDERCIEYAPIKCMNDEALNRACTNPSAPEVVYCIAASSALNSKIAVNFKGMLIEKRVSLLVPKDEGIEEINKYIPEYRKTDNPETQLFFEMPYLQTMLLFSELINLEYDKSELGIIKIHERPSLTKDRYTSVSYGCWFASELSHELLRGEEELDIDSVSYCVSAISF